METKREALMMKTETNKSARKGLQDIARMRMWLRFKSTENEGAEQAPSDVSVMCMAA